MKLIALTSILMDALKSPGSPLTVSDAEGEVLVRRQFARHPTEAELELHWPEFVKARAEEAAKLAASEAEAAAQAKAKADAEAKAKADAAAAQDAAAKAAPRATKAAKAAGNG
jgi:hypothetical protein